jgi:hypothetical protein
MSDVAVTCCGRPVGPGDLDVNPAGQVAGGFVQEGERAVLYQPIKAARLPQRTCLHGSAITTGAASARRR